MNKKIDHAKIAEAIKKFELDLADNTKITESERQKELKRLWDFRIKKLRGSGKLEKLEELRERINKDHACSDRV